ncbi:MAG: glycoside hydrolase family 95 protein [Paludibacter sp.]
MKKPVFLLILLLHLINGNLLRAQSSTKLWYTKPAEYFEETLVLGNGQTGATVFGGVSDDKIYLNDATLWTGGPVNPDMNPEAYKNIPAIREALKNNDYRLAEKLYKKVQGRFSESYAPLGTLNLYFEHSAKADHYYRELDLKNAVSTVSYEAGGVKYKREYFVSYPDKVMVIKLSASRKGALAFRLKFGSLLRHKLAQSKNMYWATGFAPVHSEPNYRGNIKECCPV